MTELRPFGDLMSDVFSLQEKYDVEITHVGDGTVNLRLYVGIINSDLLKQAQQMFAPVE